MPSPLLKLADHSQEMFEIPGRPHAARRDCLELHVVDIAPGRARIAKGGLRVAQWEAAPLITDHLMIRIEFEEPTRTTCECCGKATVRLTRFVYSGSDAYAVYDASFTNGHAERRLSGLIGLGEWGEGGEPENRIAFPFQIWTDQDNFQVGLVDAADSPWKHVDFLGGILDRGAALQNPWIKEVLRITDHMVSDDKEIVDYFAANGGLTSCPWISSVGQYQSVAKCRFQDIHQGSSSLAAPCSEASVLTGVQRPMMIKGNTQLGD